jgi:hypothetical protein
MENQIELAVKPEEFGVSEVKKGIESKVTTIRKERDVLAQSYLEIMQMDINDPKTARLARDTRLLILKNRTQGFEPSRKADKEVPLRLGQFIDSVYNAEITENRRMEDKLEEIEKHQENLLKQAREALQKKRVELVQVYLQEGTSVTINLSEMDEEVFEAFLTAKRNAFEARIAAEKKAEDERLEREKIQKLHNERFQLLLPYWQFVENKEASFGTLSQEEFDHFLVSKKTELAKYEKEQEAIREENERLKKEAEQKEAELAKEREQAQAKLEEERNKAKLKAEREQKEKDEVLYELQQERDARATELAQKEADKKAEQLKQEQLIKSGDKAILLDWINNSFGTPKSPIGLSESGNGKVLEITQKFDSFRGWALKQVEI